MTQLLDRVDAHPHWNRWRGAVERCENPRNKHYADYGSRGICMFPEWRQNFRLFAAYLDEVLGPRPTSRHTMDRIDNNKGYEPGNLRWATPSQQMANRRTPKHNTSGVRGISRLNCGPGYWKAKFTQEGVVTAKYFKLREDAEAWLAESRPKG